MVPQPPSNSPPPKSVRGERVFVTGATGFLGFALCSELIDQGATVVALTRNGTLPGNLASRGVHALRGDLLDRKALLEGLQDTAYVFHVAADVRSWRKVWAEVYRTNVEGTRLLVNLALETKPKSFVYTSSGSTLGKPHKVTSHDLVTVIDEASAYNLQHLNLVYPHTKWLGELEVLHAVDGGLHACITHPTAIFGPWDFKHNLLPLFRASLGLGGLFAPSGYRTTCDVRDVALGHVQAALLSPTGERYAFGSEQLSLLDLMTRIAKAAGGRAPVGTLPAGMLRSLGKYNEALSMALGSQPVLSEEIALQATFRAVVDSSKARRVLGYSNRPLEQTLRDAVAWYRAEHLLPTKS